MILTTSVCSLGVKLQSTIFLCDTLTIFTLRLFSGDSLLENVVLYWIHCIRVISCHYFVCQKLFNIKLTCDVIGMMGLFHEYSNQLAFTNTHCQK